MTTDSGRRGRVLAAALALAGCDHGNQAATVQVAAAADLAKAFAELGAAFEAQTHIHPVFTFAATGQLTKQIEEGAPYTLFAAANRSYVDQVVQQGRCDGATVQPYAVGHLVVWTPPGITPPKTLDELRDARFRKIAIANPEHAPYGAAAKQALTKAGLWADVAGKLVTGENVQATLQYATSGNVDAALVARSLVIDDATGAALPVDPALHAPIEQALVVCGTGADAAAAKQLAAFVASPAGRAIMTRYGFELPEK